MGNTKGKGIKNYSAIPVLTVILTLMLACSLGGGETSVVQERTPVSPIQDTGSDDSLGESVSEPHSTPERIGIKNPSGVVKAGETILMGDFSLVVRPSFEIKQSRGGIPTLYIKMVVTNLADNTKLFSYNRPGAFYVKDNLGETFTPFDNASSFYQTFHSSIDPGKFVNFESAYNAHGVYQIPAFNLSSLTEGATQIIITFDAFGPFSGFSVAIDL
jgi:hypothetical protein